MTDHVDVGTVALLREGLLAADEAAVVRAHLADCDRCGQADTHLTLVADLLATAPAPPMPSALSARIEAVLAAEAAARAAGTPAGADALTGAGPARASQRGATPFGLTSDEPRARSEEGRRRRQPPRRRAEGQKGRLGREDGAASRPAGEPGASQGTVRPPRQGGRWRARSGARLRALAAAAAIVVAGGGGYAVSQLVTQGGPAATSSSASAPRPAASGPRAPAAGMAPNSPPGSSSPAGAQPLISAVTSGTNYTARQFSSQVRAVLARYPADSSRRWPRTGAHLLPPVLTLASCVTAVTGGQHPRLVDIARYQGQPATIIIVAAHGTAPTRVWVVAADCTGARPDVLARLPLPG